MKKIILLFALFSLFLTEKSQAQCGTIMVNATNNVYPDTVTNIPVANKNVSYIGVIQIYTPTTISSLSLSSISGLPAGFTYTTSPTNGIITSGNSGCIIIQSSNVTNPIGTYPLVINTLVNGTFPLTFNGYKIVVAIGSTSNSSLIGSVTSAGNMQFNRIGTTYNNQQTNLATYRHLQVLPSNQIGAVWTTSTDGLPFYNRGTGYNRLTSTGWVNGDTSITRIEGERAGFPSYAYNPATNEEVILAHRVPTTGYSGGFIMSRRTAGTNSPWNQTYQLDTTYNVPGVMWCRTAISNNYLHVIARYTDSSAAQPVSVYKNGVKSPVVYSRYNFSSSTWEVKNTPIPGYNSGRYAFGSADAYSIDANGSNVAVLIGGMTQDLSLFKSINNGTSWTKTVVDSFKYAPYTGTVYMPDTPNTNEGTVSVLIDNTGKTHCMWSKMLVYSDASMTGYYYYPFQIEIKYWNTSRTYANKSTVGGPIDTDADGIYSILMGTSTNRYGATSVVTMPSMGMSSDGKLFCTYSAQTEYNDDGTQSYRDIHLISSIDGGNNWSAPKNITEWFGPSVECGYPSIARTVNNKIHITFSKSGNPGPNAAGQWDMQYMGIDTAAIMGSGAFTPSLSVSSNYVISDTVICKGKTVLTNLSNCTLWNDTNLISSGGAGSFVANVTKTYAIKNPSNITLRTFTITVTDSIQPVRTIGSANMSICGLTGNFALGASTTYPGPKTYSWFRNDTLIKTGTIVDSFNYPGVYKLTIADNKGCNSSINYNVTRFNSAFNPDFSSNRQSATSTPFDFNFANQTPTLASYDFVWNWGDGFKDSTNNPFVFKTYFANGTYSVKLIAKNKTTGCKDSITKTNYITCSGLLPLNFTSFKTQPSCFGSANGSLTVVPSGGVTPYQYKLDAGAYQSSNIFSNLAAGVYTIYVKDAYNTVYSRMDTLSNPAAISAGAISGATTSYINTANTYSVASQSGAAYAWSAVNGTVSAGAGSNSIQVTWGSTAGAGKVILVFSKNGCSVSDTLNVTLNTTPLSMSSAKTLPVCVGSSNASITVTAAGGVSPYLYRINNGAYQSSNTFSNLSAGIYSLDVKDAINGVVSKTDTILNPAPLTTGGISGANSVGVGTLKPYQIAAQSGAIYSWNIINGTLMAGNGTNSIQVQWAALAGAGKVIITLTKNTCTTADTMEITITASPMNLSATKTNPTCNASNNGSISLSVSGGSAPYQYSINNGAYQSSNTFSNLIAGTYLLKAKDALNSIVSISDSLIDPAPVVIGGISGPVVVGTGNSGAYTVNNHNGTSYVWSAMNGTILSGNGTPNAMVQWGASAGTGKVILKLGINGCYDSDTLEVTISGSLPFSMSTNKENLTCFGGGKITVNAVGGTMPYQYALNTGAFQTSNVFTGLSAGIYLVKAKDNSGTSLQQYDTIQNLGQAVVAGAINGPATVPTLALSTYIAGQQTGITYNWNVTGGLLASGQGTNIIQVSWGATATTGKVNLRVSNTGGCSDSSTLSVTVGTNGLNQLQGNSFSVYPNPASETVSISNNNSLKGAQVQLVDMLGRIVLEENITSNNNQYSLNIANVKPGSYLVIIKNKETYSRNKLVIE